MKSTRNHWHLFWACALFIIGLLLLVPIVQGEVTQSVGSREVAHVLASMGGEVAFARNPTGSMEARWGSTPAYYSGKRIKLSEAKVGDVVVRKDMNACHVVYKKVGPLVWTKGDSNKRADPHIVTGPLYLVTHVYFYPAARR
jgi:hypothetical protein